MRKLMVFASTLLVLAIAAAWWLDSRRPQRVALVPTLTGQTEYCLTCHDDLSEISPSHPLQTFGCVTCHGGEGLALDATLAHSSMRGGKTRPTRRWSNNLVVAASVIRALPPMRTTTSSAS